MPARSVAPSRTLSLIHQMYIRINLTGILNLHGIGQGDSLPIHKLSISLN